MSEKFDSEARLVTRRQAADALAYSTRTIQRLERDGKLPAVKLSPRATRYRLCDVLHLMNYRGHTGVMW